LTEEQKKAEEEKNKGNDAYKDKKFDLAIQHYNAAMQHDPQNIVYLLNRAAVYLEMDKFAEAIQDCDKAIEDGKAQRADPKLIARAYQRIGNVHIKQTNYGQAVEAYEKSLVEDRTPQTLQLLSKAEKLKQEQDTKSYIDPQKSAAHKEKGNELFRDGKFPEAVAEYSEAIKRNPDDYLLYSNRAACYSKLAAYVEGLRDCDECIKRNPKFAKIWVRKGHLHYFLKEFQPALNAYDQAMKLDGTNPEIEESITRTLTAMQKEGKKEDAFKNPEVQEILSDPVMRQILQDMQEDPKAAADHLKNPQIAAKIQKLVDAGVLRVSGTPGQQ